MFKKEKIGKINPNIIKTRDIVHMQEFLNGSGAGYHRSSKDWDRKESRRQEREW